MISVDCASCEKKGCCTFRGWKVFFLSEERERVANLYGEGQASKISEFYSRRNGLPIYAVTLPCPYFDSASGHCNIYDARPLVCRLFPIEIEPITGATYIDQAVCPKTEGIKNASDLVQLDVKNWCERFWQVSTGQDAVNKSPIGGYGPSKP
jgi:Fe-S-cluster containining protein